ncbi:hypothetical protein HZS_5882 [Henneguya salminicola]|nr:hypothetical protein HZS_5882 [Henneguya salminicola]
MVYNRGTEIYVPTVYALVSCKNEHIYSEIVHQIVVLMEYNWMPCIITTDFKKALISSTIQEFSESKNDGCHFHFKQNMRKKYEA